MFPLLSTEESHGSRAPLHGYSVDIKYDLSIHIFIAEFVFFIYTYCRYFVIRFTCPEQYRFICRMLISEYFFVSITWDTYIYTYRAFVFPTYGYRCIWSMLFDIFFTVTEMQLRFYWLNHILLLSRFRLICLRTLGGHNILKE